MSNYFESSEFLDLLRQFEEQVERGESPYLDADEFADVADYYLQTNRPQKAKEVLDMSIELHGKEEITMNSLAAYYIFVHQYDESRKVIEANELEGSDVFYMKAQLVYAIDNDIPASEKMFRKWLRMEMKNVDPDETEESERDAYLHVISSFVELHDNSLEHEDEIQLVRRWIEEYIDRFSPIGPYQTDVEVADICRHTNMADLLVKLLEPILQEKPYLKNGWSSLALAYLTIEDYPHAIESADFALAIDPKDKESLLTKAYSCQMLDNLTGAAECFNAYLQFDGVELWQSIPYAAVLLDLGRIEESSRYIAIGEDALESYMAAKGELSDDDKFRYVSGLNDAINVYQGLDQFEDCERCARRLVELNGESADYLYMLGNYCLVNNKVEEAMEMYSNSVLKADDKVGMLLDVALMLANNNHFEMAEEMIKVSKIMAERFGDEYESIKHIGVPLAMLDLKCDRLDSFLEHIKDAAENSPMFTKHVFGVLFDQVPVEEYYNVAKELVETQKLQEAVTAANERFALRKRGKDNIR